jgi:FAD/FMN-containing dehydrogenase
MTHEFEGPVVWRGDPTYEQIRQDMLWNALKPVRFPEAIIRAASDHDVVGAVRLAQARGLQVAVRAGGHSWIGSPLRDGTILVDLSARRTVRIDETSSTATLEPAVTSAELAGTLARHGLAFPVGHCASVGIGGYLLSGGLGWNSGAWGPACASVYAVDVVTAQGELVHADDDHHAELLWAARGAGPGFPGVVTRFHVALQPFPRAITTTTHVYDLADLDELAPWASGVAASLPLTVEMTVMLTEAGNDVPAEPDRKVAVVTATAFADTTDDAVGALAPLQRSPIRHHLLAARDHEPSPYDVLFRDFGGRWREGCRFASDNVWTDGDFTDTLLPLRQALLEAPSPASFAFAGMSPDAPAGEAEEELPDMAFSMYARTFVACYAMWQDPAADDANLTWLPSAMAQLDGVASGHYVAEADLLAADTRARRSFTVPTWDRLEDLRARVDPDGLFATFLGPPVGATTSPQSSHSHETSPR